MHASLFLYVNVLQQFIIVQSALHSSARVESSWSPRYNTRALSACVDIARVLWADEMGNRVSLQQVKFAAEMAPLESVYRSGYFTV